MHHILLLVVPMRFVTVVKHQIVRNVKAKKSKKKSSAEYYRKNKKARDKKKKYDTEYHSSKARRRYRAFLVKMRRKAGRYGNGDGKDYDHDEKRFISAKRNRSKK